MGSSASSHYCSFTKVVEHLGDKWCLLILRELVMFGPQGFNALAVGLPGHVSRSVLTDRLRTLSELGLIARSAPGPGHQAAYHLTDDGLGLVPTLLALRDWAESYLPQDPAMVERDPDVVLGWLAERVDRTHLPDSQAVVEIAMRHRSSLHRGWVILAPGQEPNGCLEDPALDESRYVYLESSAAALLGVARGRRALRDAIADGSITAYGDPVLVHQVGTWFLPADGGRGRRSPSTTGPVAALSS